MDAYTKNLFAIGATIVKQAADPFGNHGCNNLPSDFFDAMTPAKKERLCAEMRQWNSEDRDPWPERPENIGVAGLLNFIAYKMTEMSKA